MAERMEAGKGMHAPWRSVWTTRCSTVNRPFRSFSVADCERTLSGWLLREEEEEEEEVGEYEDACVDGMGVRVFGEVERERIVICFGFGGVSGFAGFAISSETMQRTEVSEYFVWPITNSEGMVDGLNGRR